MNGLLNNNYYVVYLPVNGKELVRLLGATIAYLHSENRIPYKIVCDVEAYFRIENALRNIDKREWKSGTFMGLEVSVTDKIGKASYVLWRSDELQQLI